jgi:hypothetical protein
MCDVYDGLGRRSRITDTAGLSSTTTDYLYCGLERCAAIAGGTVTRLSSIATFPQTKTPPCGRGHQQPVVLQLRSRSDFLGAIHGITSGCV